VSASPGLRRGIPASPGIAIGPAYVLRRERLIVPEYRVASSQAEAEIARLEAAFHSTRSRLDEIRHEMQTGGLVGSIFDAQFLFLEDPALLQNAIRNIRENGLNAEWALERELRRVEAMFESIADPYIRERSSDVGFIVRRVLQALMGREPEGLGNAPEGVVVVAEDLSPAEVAQIRRDRIAGLVTEGGSRTSHVTIMARSLEIPAVVGAGHGLVREIADGTPLLIDGRTGALFVDPDPGILEEYRKQRIDLQAFAKELLRYSDLPAETRDGVEIRMLANVDKPEEIPDALHYGAEGVGLYRTEFLFMNRTDVPTEEEQFEAYRVIVEAVAPHEAVIRTLDLGADKIPSRLFVSAEPNPALGLRGMRFSLARPDLFRTQIRALLRASAFGRLAILLPMVSGLAEVKFARRMLAEVRTELAEQGVPMAPEIPLGVMIETPSAAVIADLIVPLVDFLSIGTNDLLQYMLAVDRTNEQVAYLYEPLHPAHLRMIQSITQAARRAGIPVAMCGEMASEPLHVWILLALGIDELSMAPFSIPMLKKILRESTAREARQLLSDVLSLGSAREVFEYVERTMRARFPTEFEGIALAG
jgi:phosphotransferase system enzyme I (PtsI)